MAKKIPFLLKMEDGFQARTIEELREHFSLAAVLDYYSSGRLVDWLASRYYDEEAEKIKALDSHTEDFKENLCGVLGVAYQGNEDDDLSLSGFSRKNKRREYLKEFTADDKILDSVDNVAFTQEELENLIQKKEKVIYLCGDQFVIPADIGEANYIGINNPTIELKIGLVREDMDISGVKFNLSSYMDDAISNIGSRIKNDIINGVLSYEGDGCPTDEELQTILSDMDNRDKLYYYFYDNPQLWVKLLRMAVEKDHAVALFLLSGCYADGVGEEENTEKSMDCLQRAAGLGLPEAQEYLGHCYLQGKNIEKNREEALKWFQKAAEQGNIDAQIDLGNCYTNSQYGLEENFSEGIEWYRKAAEQGSLLAQSTLGQFYMMGKGVEKNYKESLKWLLKAAGQDDVLAWKSIYECYTRYLKDDAENAIKLLQKNANNEEMYAQSILGLCYENGIGVNSDYYEAVRWYKKAAEQGDETAQYNLGVCYYNGQGVEKNGEEAVKWYRKAAEQGSSSAQCGLGDCYYNGIGVEQDFAEAVNQYRDAAYRGDSTAQYSLGMCCYNGQGVEQNYEEAVRWFLRAAEQGDKLAQYNLGVCYYNGQGVEKNNEEAARWYKEAAEQDYVEAQNSLGVCYYNGQGVEQNYEEAVRWYRKAAEQGNKFAQNNLGACYYNGQGVEKNDEEAAKWLHKSYAQGYEAAKPALIEVAPKLFKMSDVILYAVGGKENLRTGTKLDMATGEINIYIHDRSKVNKTMLSKFGAIDVWIEEIYFIYHMEKMSTKQMLRDMGETLKDMIKGALGAAPDLNFMEPDIKKDVYEDLGEGCIHMRLMGIDKVMEADFNNNVKSQCLNYGFRKSARIDELFTEQMEDASVRYYY